MLTIPPAATEKQEIGVESLVRVPGTSLESLTQALLSGKTTAMAVGAAHGMSPKQFHKALTKAYCAEWQTGRGPWPPCVNPVPASRPSSPTTPSAGTRPDACCPSPNSCTTAPLTGSCTLRTWWPLPGHGTRVIILGLRHWDPVGGKSKHQILREMLDEVIATGLKADWLLFDGWYLNPEMVLWCYEQRIQWASRLRRDRLVETAQGPSRPGRGIPHG